MRNNFISICSGAGIAIMAKGQELVYATTQPHIFEFFKVFVLGIIGGLGGYLGRLLIHKLITWGKRKFTN